MSIINIIKNLILDTIFPISCIGQCGRFDIWLCDNCVNKMEIKPRSIKIKDSFLNGLYYSGSYKNQLLSTALHFFKYKYIADLSRPLGKIMIQTLSADSNFDLIAFVPMHRKKELIRCFNQTYLLAKEVSKYYNWPIVKGVLQKNKNTAAQMSLDKKQRKDNLMDAFVCKNKKAVFDKKILIVDDVYTTGTTLNECAKVLKQAGAKTVYGIVLAKGS